MDWYFVLSPALPGVSPLVSLPSFYNCSFRMIQTADESAAICVSHNKTNGGTVSYYFLYDCRLSCYIQNPLRLAQTETSHQCLQRFISDGNFMYVHLMIIIILRLLYHYNLAIRFDFHSVQYNSPGTRLMRERRFTSPELCCSCLSLTPSYGRLQTCLHPRPNQPQIHYKVSQHSSALSFDFQNSLW